MTSELVLAANVRWLPVKKDERTRDKEFAKKLSRSIQIEGLHQPILVIPDPDKPGHHIGVDGWHRWFGSSQVLKQETIEAKVRTDMDASDVEMATIATNLMRNPLNKIQQARAITRWHEHYERKHADYAAAKKAREVATSKVATSSGPTKKAKRKVQLGPGGTSLVPESSESEVETSPLPSAPPTNFAVSVAEMTGVSATTVKRQLAIGKAFTDEQAEVLDQMGVTQVAAETIAKLKEGERGDVVKLIALGLEPGTAIGTVRRTDSIEMANGEVRPVDAKEEAELADREWVELQCGELLALLPSPESFISDAILYRQTRDQRAAFAHKSKKPLADARKAGHDGSYYEMLHRLCQVAHPKHWIRCGKCQGHGRAIGKQCPDCDCRGYQVKLVGG